MYTHTETHVTKAFIVDLKILQVLKVKPAAIAVVVKIMDFNNHAAYENTS